ncbi:pathogenesis-related protein 1-like [Phalaenopsis equestris]|uniref:pathogenesis-related protein 1-like n=1 Tax=Phalaenopsis equestris TaxID=78828 RepID=UPI0009E496B2|nr:pathogenesis-related protein 1-like [Phalaenopsis equestris]
MVKGSFTDESFWSVEIDRLWKARIIDGHNLLPKLLPDFISHVKIIEGDGGIGTVRQLNFNKGKNEYDFVMEKIVALDSDCYRTKETVIKGGLIGSRMISYSLEHKFEKVSEHNTRVKLTVEYESFDEKPLSVEEQNLLVVKLTGVMKAIEGYLHTHPTAYV